jgi:SpoVK/Ycf46/Vps4 family AAA+-type ATPase
MYDNGGSLPLNHSEAAKWYLKAAALEWPSDVFETVGDMYQHGRGVKQDYTEAAKWYQKALEHYESFRQHSRETYGTSVEVSETEIRIRARLSNIEDPSKTDTEKLAVMVSCKGAQSPLDELFVELNKLIGLERVKEEIDKLIKFVKVQKIRHSKGLKGSSLSLHCVFFGNPGTGKTTIARIYGKMLNTMGLLSKGHLVETDRSGLVAGYIGQTESKTDQKIKEAIGGILFIDEAYSLYKGEEAQWDYGAEAISILLKRMEDHRDDLVVIVAGYDKPMAEFLQSNEGLKSRFKTKIHFPDYNPEELVKIFELFCVEDSYEIQRPALDLVQYALENEHRARDETFGNARLVRNLFESVVLNQSLRIAETTEDPTHSDLVTIITDDVRSLLDRKREPVAPSY